MGELPALLAGVCCLCLVLLRLRGRWCFVYKIPPAPLRPKPGEKGVQPAPAAGVLVVQRRSAAFVVAIVVVAMCPVDQEVVAEVVVAVKLVDRLVVVVGLLSPIEPVSLGPRSDDKILRGGGLFPSGPMGPANGDVNWR